MICCWFAVLLDNKSKKWILPRVAQSYSVGIPMLRGSARRASATTHATHMQHTCNFWQTSLHRVGLKMISNRCHRVSDDAQLYWRSTVQPLGNKGNITWVVFHGHCTSTILYCHAKIAGHCPLAMHVPHIICTYVYNIYDCTLLWSSTRLMRLGTWVLTTWWSST